MNIKEVAKQLKFKLKAVYLAYKNKNTPIIAKIFAAFTVGYALSPIDLIPDFIPILGYLDDLIILPLLIYISIKLIPKEIMKDCEAKSKELWKEGKPKKLIYAVPIILIWITIIIFLIYKVI